MAAKMILLIIMIAFRSESTPRRANRRHKILDVIASPTHYNKAIPPFPNDTSPVVVRTNMKFSHCSLDDLTMLLQIDLTITMKWQDYRFSSDIPEPSIHFSDASNFWVPRGFFKDNFEMVQRSEDIKIITTGEVLYTVDVTATLHCPLNLKRFPHDRQICPIQFSTYSSTEDLILLYEDIEFVRPPSLLRYYLRGTKKGHCNFKTPSGVYACLKADLFLERKFSTYLFEWYVPCACFVIISFCSLFMKTSCFLARLVLTLGPLLSLILSSLNYYRNLPRVTHFTALDEFTGTSCFFAFVIFIYVIISHIFGGSKTTEEEEGSDTDSDSKWRRLYRALKHMFGRIVKTALVVCYLSFLVGYYFVYRDTSQEEDDEEQSNIQYY